MRTVTAILFLAGLASSGAPSAGTIQQTIVFPGVDPQVVYDTYLSAKGHSDMTGFPASFYRPSTKAEVAVAQEGDEFRGFGVTGKDGKLQYLIGGRILHLVPGREIVMTWHAMQWDEHRDPAATADPDCVLLLTLKPNHGGTELQLVQVDIPDYPGLDPSAATAQYTSETAEVNSNWYFRYWAPMQKYFATLPQAPAKP